MTNLPKRHLLPPCVLASAALVALGCSSESTGTLRVLLEPEEGIVAGLEAGEAAGTIQDGWSATFDHFVVALGGVELTREGETVTAGEEGTLVDLTTLPAAGSDWLEVEGLPIGRHDFGFSIVSADQTENVEGVDDALVARMKADKLAFFLSGTLTKSGGVSCPPADKRSVGERAATGENAAGVECFENETITFEIPVSSTLSLGPCELDGIAGVAITDGSDASVAVTMHGDHLFFNGFPEGDESTVRRLAQWIADSDLNLDGAVTWEELGQLSPSDLSEFDSRYELATSPLEIATLQDYVTAQIVTQGHYQGEGECSLHDLDGLREDYEHDHGDEHDHADE